MEPTEWEPPEDSLWAHEMADEPEPPDEEDAVGEPIACHACGQLKGVPEYDARLWDIYRRLRDGRATAEPLVFTQDDLDDDPDWWDDRENSGTWLAMERDMAARGLCTECGRPDLSGVTADQVMTEEESREMHDYWAEVAAERRMGC